MTDTDQAKFNEKSWDSLLSLIEDRRVIPVVGEELLTVQVEGREMSLYCAVAEGLLQEYGLRPADQDVQGEAGKTVLLRPHQELNDAVCSLTKTLAEKGESIQDLYSPANKILRTILGPRPAIPKALHQLARVPNFDLFVSTTFDDLLVRALNSERGGGSPITEEILYAPGLPGDQIRDIPEIRPSNYCAVLYLFGRASAEPFYAIHDEDILEFVYNLQTGRGAMPERMLSEIRQRNLLFIGCNFADWLSRFFIRLSSKDRLSVDRQTRKFLVGRDTFHDRGLALFLDRFSRSARVFPGDAVSFVGELARRWGDRHPHSPEASAPDAALPKQAPGTGGIFISYSRTDLPAARTLSGELQEIGKGVIWFDKGVLKPGDEWEHEIMSAIERCDLFLPLISSTTESRPEGFFRREWKRAGNRLEGIQGQPFIFPIIVDPTYDGNAGQYRLVPKEFQPFHFGHAPEGRMSDDLRQAIKEAIRDIERMRKK